MIEYTENDMTVNIVLELNPIIKPFEALKRAKAKTDKILDKFSIVGLKF